MNRFPFLVACVVVLLAPIHAAAQESLRSPWDLRISLTDAPYDCPAKVHLSRDLTTDGFYSDSKSSVIDPAKWQAYVASSGPIKNLGNQAVAAADVYRTTGSRSAAHCTLRMLTTAAADGVLTGKMSSHQAYFVQGWVVGGLAIAYLKVRDSGFVSAEEAASIANWMRAVTHQTMDFYDAARAKPGSESQNNHLYWAGVQVAAVAIAVNDRSMFDWAMATYKNGVAQISPEGTLPLEMRRGQRALHYHLYAIAPLVYLAEFGEDNGLDLYAENGHALQRLVDRSIAGLAGSGYFDSATGIKQDTPHGAPTAEEISWAKVYVQRFPNAQMSSLIAQASSLSYMYLGGLPPPD